ncbi:MAG: hypothetical protein ABSF83_13825 [Nitrososphaerales archaeon]|jgi:hypothetical protein
MSPPARAVLDGVAEEVGAISLSLGTGAGGAPSELEVWRAYARTEKTVARLKYRLGAERPGVFTELPRSADLTGLLRDAGRRLDEARALAAEDHPAECLEALRVARTCLRAYLAELGRIRSREKRRLRKLAPPSPSPF